MTIRASRNPAGRPRGSTETTPRPMTAKTGNRFRTMAADIEAIATRASKEQRARLAAISAALIAEAEQLKKEANNAISR